MKLFRIVLIALIVTVAVLAAPIKTPARAQGDSSDVCGDFSGLSGTIFVIHGTTYGITGTPNPGDTFTLVFTLGTSHAASVAMVGNGLGSPVLAGPASVPTTLTYTVPAEGLPAGSIGVGFYFVTGDEGSINIEASCGKGAVAGCDVLMGLPSTSVVGAFVSDALLYAEPGVSTYPELTLSAGKTAWVLGMDKTKQYYKILWVCDYLWVKVGTMGPNYDAVWQGRPLPTNIVQ
jgi:hypothetical protein